MFFLISTHFTATPGIPLSPSVLKTDSIKCSSTVEPWDFTPDLSTRLDALYASKSEQRLLPPSYRGCWYGVSRSFFYKYRLILPAINRQYLRPCRKGFTIRRHSSPTRRRSIRVSPIVEASRLLPPVGVWAVSQSQCGRSPAKAGYPSMPW